MRIFLCLLLVISVRATAYGQRTGLENFSIKTYKLEPFTEGAYKNNEFVEVRMQTVTDEGVAVFTYNAATGKIASDYRVFGEKGNLISSVEYDTTNTKALTGIGGVCLGYKHGWSRKYFADGSLREEVRYGFNLMQGHYKYWDAPGHLEYECYYKNGKMDSCAKQYFEKSAQLFYIRWYRNGERLFDDEEWYPNGQKQTFRRLYPVMREYRWYQNGDYESLGVRDSIFLRWEDRKLKHSVTWDKSLKQWVDKTFDDHGLLFIKIVSDSFVHSRSKVYTRYEYENGKLVKTATAKGNPIEKEKRPEAPDTGHSIITWKNTVLPAPVTGYGDLEARLDSLINERGSKKPAKGSHTLSIVVNGETVSKAEWTENDEWNQSRLATAILELIRLSRWHNANVNGKTAVNCAFQMEVRFEK